MTEKEKMTSGMEYDATDGALVALREKCQALCLRLNSLPPNCENDREALVKQIFGRTGKANCVVSPFMCDYGFNIETGENFFMNAGCVILDEAKVSFGDNVFIGPQCGFYTAIHPLDAESRRRGIESAKPVSIGSDVWIGGHVTVLPGVSIGDGAVIGAGSVVTKDIPPHVVAAGNPARVLREL